MKSLYEACKPRKSVFDTSRKDTVLDLTDFIDNRVNAEEFFSENYMTEGMEVLLTKAFERLEGDSNQGLYLLSQSMGGGKTHNLFSLGLLAKHPKLRREVLKGKTTRFSERPIRVAAFNGRESEARYGIWGAIAQQLNKRDELKDYYSPLKAPGQTTWVNLLKGEPLLILLDELPAYLDNATSTSIGNSNLANVTTTALSNLFVAINKNELSNVCIVLSDLKAAYEGGTGYIADALETLHQETQRSAVSLEPVRMNTDEIYHILRTRLFETLPDEKDVLSVAQAYGKSLAEAREMDLTSASPENLVTNITSSYPFHPSIRDLYARFKENQGFQQTRGLIRLMRLVVTNLYAGKEPPAKNKYLIAPHDIDLNDAAICSEIKGINSHLSSAIAKDIASGGHAIAEELDGERKTPNIQDTCKCLLVASLANVPNAVLGLTDSELIANLAEPGRDIRRLNEDISVLSSRAWYLHTSRERKRYFKNVENLNARLNDLAKSYSKESRTKQIRTYLESFFQPSLKDCYQDIKVLPGIDEIELTQDKVTLVIFEPHKSEQLHPDLNRFWQDTQFKNRILFLTGHIETMKNIDDSAAQMRAIDTIIDELESEKVPANDPQMMEAKELKDKLSNQFRSAVRETFTTLIYPHKDQMRTVEFSMTFESNDYNGEKQIREALSEKQKFTKDVGDDSFRKKCEQRLFGNQTEMRWNDIKRRAATSTDWPWHEPNVLDYLRTQMISQDYWREHGDYVEKGPFPPPATDVQIQQKHRDDDTGEVILRLTPVRGDKIFYRNPDEGKEFSVVEKYDKFESKALRLEFKCEDSKGEHKTGDPVTWANKITLKCKIFQDGQKRMFELQSAPKAKIRYTTDGSSSKSSGTAYSEPFEIPKSCTTILAIAESNGIYSDEFTRSIDWSKSVEVQEVDKDKPAIWARPFKLEGTHEVFSKLDLFEKHGCTLIDPDITIYQGQRFWVRLEFGSDLEVEVSHFRAVLDRIRENLLQGDRLLMDIKKLKFSMGISLLNLVRDLKEEFKPGEVEQFVSGQEKDRREQPEQKEAA